MYNHRCNPHDTTNSKTGKVTRKKGRDIYCCSLYQIHRGDCTMHYINTGQVGELILETIRGATAYARSNEAEFIQIIREASAVRRGEAAKSHKKQIAKNERRVAELDTLFRKTYEDFAAGRLNEKRFGQLSSGYESEQETLERQTAELKAELEQFDRDSFRADKFLELARRYADITELTSPLLREFVEKVVIHEADKSSGRREQKVEIYLNHIGQFAVPGKARADRDDADEEKRAKWRERKRDQRAKEKQRPEPAQKEKTA
jgi:hypothetical protein